MIKRQDVMKFLINECPSFKYKWEEHLNDIWDRDSEQILYTDLAMFSKHLVELISYKNFNEVEKIFDNIEYLLQEGDSFVKDAIVIGFLEDVQNCLISNGYNLKVIENYLKSETKKYWVEIIRFWNKENL